MPALAKVQYVTSPRFDANVREYDAMVIITDVEQYSGPASLYVASGFPQMGTPYEVGADVRDNYCVVVGYSNVGPVNWEKDRTTYRATVHYSTDPNKQRRPAQNFDNPLDKPPIISGGGRRSLAVAYRKRLLAQPADGRAVVNTANGFFPDEEVTVDDDHGSIRITKNYPTLDLTTLEDYANSVNATEWMGGAPRTWKMAKPTWRFIYGPPIDYYEVTYEFEQNDETWDLKPKNIGKLDKNFRLPLVGGAGQYTYFPLDKDGEFFSSADVPPIVFDGVGDNPKPFRWYKERIFTTLGLPAALPAA